MSNTVPVTNAEPTNSGPTNTVPKILVVGGGYAGFYTAWKLEKHLRKGEAAVTIVDPLPYMTYQPFLPEVAAGSIEARHSVVALRRHLKRTKVVTAKVTGIDHAHKTATLTPAVGEPWQEQYDQIVITAGTAALGVMALNAALEGYFVVRLDMVKRALLFVAGVCLFLPIATTEIVGAALLAATTAWLWAGRKTARTSPGIA